MRILLTGGSGFIGRNLLEGLKDEYEVFAPRHAELEVTDTNAVRTYLKKNKINVVIHTAVKGGDTVLENILRMFMSIYSNLDLLDRFINFGSGAEYAKTRDLKEVKETELGKYIPQDNYGLGKLICSQLSSGNKKIVTLLPFGIYGKYEDYRFKFISNSIVKNLFCLPIKIKQDVIFDYLYIKDLIPVVRFFLKNQKFFGDYNLTTTRSISLKEIVEIINKISDKPSKITIEDRNYNFQYTGSNKKIKSVMKNFQPTSYFNAIKDLYLYYKKNIDFLNKNGIIKDEYFIKSKIKK